MRGDKLIALIGALNITERDELIEFASIDFHNNKKAVKNCIKNICHFASNNNLDLLDDQALFQLIFPKKETFNDEKLRDLIYFTTLIVNDYLVYKKSKESKEYRDIVYRDFLNERHLFKLLDQQLKGELKKVKAKKLLSVDDYHNIFDLNKRRYLIEEEDNFKKTKAPIEEALDALDQYYFAEKLKWSHELLGSEMVVSHKYNLRFLDEVLKESSKDLYKKNQFIYVYYLITLFYKKNVSKANYLSLKEAILKILPQVQHQVRRSLIIDLNNYALKLYSISGDFEEIHEMHEVNVIGIEYDAFLKKNKFGNRSALNIANVALRLNKTEWVFEFINKIKHRLEEPNMLHLIEAMTAFQLGDYDTVRDKLIALEYSDVYITMTAKSFLAKTYFMQKEYALLDNHLKALELFYRRNKILSKALIESNLNFVLSLRKIMKHVNTPSKLTNICTEIEGVNNMAYKAWVHSILKQLLT